MAYNYLNKVGLTNLWGNIKSYIASKLSSKAENNSVVHLTGNETISGNKIFNGGVIFNKSDTSTTTVSIQRTDYIRGTAPTETLHNAFRVYDSVGNIVGECCTENLNTGENRLNLNIRNTNSKGNQVSSCLLFSINTEDDINNFYPSRNGVINLGLSNYKWNNVYANTFNGNLVGNATSATKATQDANGDVITDTYATKSENALKANNADVVHTTGNETINGIKYFTSGPQVTNNQTTMGYSITNTALARNDVPSEYYHHSFRAHDKNYKILGEYCIEKSTTGDTLLNMGVRSEDANGNQIANSLLFKMTNDGSVVKFMPSANNKVYLGDEGAKWLKVYSDDVVHTRGDETIVGTKTFSSNIVGNLKGNADTATKATTADSAVNCPNYLPLSGGCLTNIFVGRNVDNSFLHLSSCTDHIKGAMLIMYGEGSSDLPGSFRLIARNSSTIHELCGNPNGELFWSGKSVSLEGHTHDDRYYTKTEVNNLLNGKATQDAIVLAFCSSAVNNGSTVAGTELKVAKGGTSGAFTATTETLTGTYRALNTVVANGVGMFVKIA